MRFEVWDTTELLSVYISKKISENKFFRGGAKMAEE